MVESMRRCGAIVLDEGAIRWRVWAPKAKQVMLNLGELNEFRQIDMSREAHGFFSCEQRGLAPGQRYRFSLDGGEPRCDPCSLFQPDGIMGPSAVVATQDFSWTDEHWKGIARQDLVFYELHVGTFTAEGTFDAMIPRLPAIRELGITAIEVMPIGQFPGKRNWGYDGVYPYAAQNSYGGPAGFARFVDAAHAAGLAVFLDVVYNHLGPEGNYLNEFGPYFTEKYRTPWGQALNFDERDSEPVRDFVIDNARMWLREFHVDGLRLDAVHSIFDLGARPLLRAIQQVAEAERDSSQRLVHIVAESDQNDPRLVGSPDRGGFGIDGQWADDFHHSVHVMLTGERQGYYADYEPLECLVQSLNSPFVYAGNYSPFRGRKHGAPPTGLGGDRFVACLQNHDQIGNRATGDRLWSQITVPSQRRLAVSLLLLSPYLPLIFMGEEYGETRPFPFFCSFIGADLVHAVREGRRREFADFLFDVSKVPDPGDARTFQSAILKWSWPEGSDRAGLRRLYGDLLRARRQWKPLRDVDHRQARLVDVEGKPRVIQLSRGNRESGTMTIFFNCGSMPASLDDAGGPLNLMFSSENGLYGGTRAPNSQCHQMLPWECLAFADLPPDATSGTRNGST